MPFEPLHPTPKGCAFATPTAASSKLHNSRPRTGSKAAKNARAPAMPTSFGELLPFGTRSASNVVVACVP